MPHSFYLKQVSHILFYFSYLISYLVQFDPVSYLVCMFFYFITSHFISSTHMSQDFVLAQFLSLSCISSHVAYDFISFHLTEPHHYIFCCLTLYLIQCHPILHLILSHFIKYFFSISSSLSSCFILPHLLFSCFMSSYFLILLISWCIVLWRNLSSDLVSHHISSHLSCVSSDEERSSLDFREPEESDELDYLPAKHDWATPWHEPVCMKLIGRVRETIFTGPKINYFRVWSTALR